MNYIHRLYILYICIMLFAVYLKPRLMFHPDGTLKNFGINKGKTIFPLWLFGLLLVIFIYFGYIFLLNFLKRN